MDRLQRQIEFVAGIDRLKSVYRQSFLLDGSRSENDVEHSWHIAMMAVLLSEYADERVDLSRVVKMLLIHDIVEIDAGDVFVYDAEANKGKEGREKKAADRLFNILPPDQAAEMRALWDEYEERRTPEAKFAMAMDRLQPMLQNYFTQGKSWRAHGVTARQVLSVNARIQEGSEALWEYAQRIVSESVEKGYIKP
ncbi:putative metal-dependent phosphohydrolase [Methanocella paludicola SANAE]|uniref:5'-deoxynucleotidase n=1 Tax=Methanocella paludicola (strain DSM 17711 / JCM 13418 / NBRC 101707 / SANAE) TaxID=304371 RepID=D1Z0A6_METPS|nr:HD domain-containing protein [Methanocella paludicola]BAI62128.1 putative metal-dependent phosphohydrolase [Methanocella paludicola SANAE]